MNSVEIYSFEDRDGVESTFTTRVIAEAKRFARENNLKLIANVFEFADSELVEDNTKADDRDEDDA
jgi:hypothetical protein